jgi:hypothetical protein
MKEGIESAFLILFYLQIHSIERNEKDIIGIEEQLKHTKKEERIHIQSLAWGDRRNQAARQGKGGSSA